MNLGKILSKAIKEGKWLDIQYKNINEETTHYWIAIIDIDIDEKILIVNMFNDKKSYNSLKANIYFDNILSARVINFSDYDVPSELIEKIESNLDNLKWLNYDRFNNNILYYYNECNYLDNDPYQKEYMLIPGIDIRELRKKKEYFLNDEQMKILIDKIYRYDINNNFDCKRELCISVCSIDNGDKKYLICYYEVFFNPHKKSLVVHKQLKFNNSFLIDGRKHSLFNYVNMDIETFKNQFISNYHEMVALLRSNLKHGEVFNDRPEMFLLEREYIVDLTATYEMIEDKYYKNELNVPMKSFFGNISKRNYIRRKEPTIAIYDQNININQLRVVYNAMKYPVTYVQGPPGTGKTQTILNVLISSLFDNKTVLVCSSNNKPVDGIIEKLDFHYYDNKVLFPFLRLGKISEVIEATLKIKELYELSSDKVVKENLINQIKLDADNANEQLLKLLNTQERKITIEEYIESSNKLIEGIANSTSSVSENIKRRIIELKEELDELPEITNKDITELIKPVKESKKLLQFIYFKSLSYVFKLKEPKYKELIDICYIEDEEERATLFNKWIGISSNMKILNNAFPFIFSTNISSHRLGGPDFMFDLVVMDEAGQCNIAHALIPISKAQSLLLVGDPNQLKPVIVLDDSVNQSLLEKYNVLDSYSYKNNSILDVMIAHDNISKYILLKYHYRCGKKIIDFSNHRYYGSSLDLSYLKKDGELEFLSVENKNVSDKNSASEEANAVIKYIKSNNIKDAYIITPFVNQKNLIDKLLKENNIEGINCGTIHSLQGAEKETIIFSTALSYKTAKSTYEWIKNNFELINVGVTRAKNKLVISADKEALDALSDKKDDLYNLVDYAIKDGKVHIDPSETSMIQIGKSNGSKNEEEFYKTISHFCSVNSSYEVKRNVPFRVIFSNDEELSKINKEFDIVIYERKWPRIIPKIVIELNGGEHIAFKSRQLSDKYKLEVCKQRKLKFIMVDNSFIKSYEYLIDIIIGSKNKKMTQISLFDLED